MLGFYVEYLKTFRGVHVKKIPIALLTTLGTNSTLHNYKNTIHGFVQFYQLIPEGEEALKEACNYIEDHRK